MEERVFKGKDTRRAATVVQEEGYLHVSVSVTSMLGPSSVD